MSNANQDRDRNGRFTEGATANKQKSGAVKNKTGSHAAQGSGAGKGKSGSKW